MEFLKKTLLPYKSRILTAKSAKIARKTKKILKKTLRSSLLRGKRLKCTVEKKLSIVDQNLERRFQSAIFPGKSGLKSALRI